MYNLSPAAYIWTHGYLRTIQVGIQSAHVVAELFVKYQGHGAQSDMPDSMAYEWASSHKAIRLLNGGTGTMFQSNYAEMITLGEKYDFEVAHFVEPDFYDQMTAFGLILDPRTIYDIDHQRDILRNQGYTNNDREMDEFPLVQFLKRCRSAD
jgi:hypothetical protein